MKKIWCSIFIIFFIVGNLGIGSYATELDFPTMKPNTEATTVPEIQTQLKPNTGETTVPEIQTQLTPNESSSNTEEEKEEPDWKKDWKDVDDKWWNIFDNYNYLHNFQLIKEELGIKGDIVFDKFSFTEEQRKVITDLEPEEWEMWKETIEIVAGKKGTTDETKSANLATMIKGVYDEKYNRNEDWRNTYTEEQLKKLNRDQIIALLGTNNQEAIEAIPQAVRDEWDKTMEGAVGATKQTYESLMGGNTLDEVHKDSTGASDLSPGASTGLLGNADVSASHTPDEIIGEANDFLDKGSAVTTIDGGNLKQASSTLYNILLSIGILLAVGIGMYLGVKFMVSTAEDKAKVKEAMIPYIAGCIVIFSAFVIWKAAILLLGGIG